MIRALENAATTNDDICWCLMARINKQLCVFGQWPDRMGGACFRPLAEVPDSLVGVQFMSRDGALHLLLQWQGKITISEESAPEHVFVRPKQEELKRRVRRYRLQLAELRNSMRHSSINRP